MSAKIFHIPFVTLTPKFKLHSIVQRSPSTGSSAPADHPDLKHYTDVKDLFQDPEVDVVIVTTPPNTHFELAALALENGKHVLVEKPFVPTAKQADQLIALAKEKQRLICVYQNRRWDADFLTVKKLIADGTLGRIYEFETHFDRYRAERPATWKGKLGIADGGSALYDLGSHLIDQVYSLFGTPSSVYGKFTDQRDGKFSAEDPDSITAQLAYDDTGLLVHVRIGVLSVETQQVRFWVRGSNGTYHKNGLDAQEAQLQQGMKPSEVSFGHEDASWSGRVCLRKDDGSIVEESCPTVTPETYLRLFLGFADAIDSGKEEDVPVPPSQARDVLEILEALQVSAREGREVRLS
jgi:predicted dehydrogenase